MKRIIAVFLLMIFSIFPAFADFKLTQQVNGINAKMIQEFTIYAKGVRTRSENRMIMEGMPPEAAAMMAKNMPNFVRLQQCDLKQDATLSEPKKSYFLEYYDWSQPTPEQLKRRPAPKWTIKGTMSMSSVVTDSGKRQQMFGLTAKWLKVVRTFESSADSCQGKTSARIEEEGWYVNIILNSQTCDMPKPPPSEGGCRPKFIIKSMQNPGFLLEGISTMYQNEKPVSTNKTKTTALSTATLDQSLFEIPKDWTEVDSFSELMPSFSNVLKDTSATTIVRTEDGKTKSQKTIAIDYFSGNASKVHQEELRNYISQKLTAAGMSGFPINSQAELMNGKFANTIGVEIKKIKESGASKIGGLFGKVTGNDGLAKAGDSEAEIVVTIYGSDGKTVVATATATEKVKGKGDDAVKAGIDKVLGGLLEKIK
jgi:hypothetical protein